MLINFKLLSSQFAILFTSLFFTLISNRWSSLGGNAFTHALGWWVILSTLNLHFTGSALTLNRLIEGGLSTVRRRVDRARRHRARGRRHRGLGVARPQRADGGGRFRGRSALRTTC